MRPIRSLVLAGGVGAAVLVLASDAGARIAARRASRAAPVAAPSDAPSVPGAPVPTAAARAVRVTYRRDLATFRARLARLDSAVAAMDGPHGRTAARAAFRDARTAWKRVEGLAETLAPSAAQELNGAAVPEVEQDDGVRDANPVQGFQAVEALLWGDAPVDAEELRALVGAMRGVVARLDAYARDTAIPDAAVFDAAREELARVAVLGLAGFDSPVALHTLPEAADALRGVRVALAPYAPSAMRRAPAAWGALVAVLDSGIAALASAGDSRRAFERFDRLRFVVGTTNPAARRLAEVRDALGVPVPRERRLWRPDVATPFERGAFDPHAFAPGWAPAPTPALVALGRSLFHDGGLSADGTRSCATCHQPGRAFTDGRVRPLLRAGVAPVRPVRNTPTLLDAALQAAQGADLRAGSLEDQALLVVRDHAEMGGSWEALAARLSRDPRRAAAIAAATGRAVGALPSVREHELRAALAAYLRTLVTLESPVDRALRGDTLALTADARRGFTLFMGKAKCGTCHFAPLFNGTVPPAFRKAEAEVLGVPTRPVVRHARLDPDPGRFGEFDAPVWRHAFKTPTVRNVAVTAPYMHNGAYRTLEAVLDFYDRGGGAGIGAATPNQTLPPEPLHLTRREKAQLVAFLHALTDTTTVARR